VNWETFPQFKASFHNHSGFSDGAASRRAMILEAYSKGFHIFAFSDHDWVTPSWSEEGFGDWDNKNNRLDIPTEREVERIEAGVFGNYGREHGMISVPYGIEHSQSVEFDHINSYWVPYFNTAAKGTETEKMRDILSYIEEHGGLSFINHLGQSTCPPEIRDLDKDIDLNFEHETVKKYADIFMDFSSCAGLEIISRLDFDSRRTRVLWDLILSETMPRGRPVWGFSSDDAHGIVGIGYSYNIMLMPELTQEATKEAMQTGAFFAAARVARLEGVNHTVAGTDEITPGAAHGAERYLLDEPMPAVSEIVVYDNKIIINAADYNVIEWIADGKIIAVGDMLDLNAINIRDVIKSYVRAQIKSEAGILFTQPFGIALCCGNGECGNCELCGNCVCTSADCQQVKCAGHREESTGGEEHGFEYVSFEPELYEICCPPKNNIPVNMLISAGSLLAAAGVFLLQRRA
jgi:hypothetical protein